MGPVCRTTNQVPSLLGIGRQTITSKRLSMVWSQKTETTGSEAVTHAAARVAAANAAMINATVSDDKMPRPDGNVA
jgi:hypothetical protein